MNLFTSVASDANEDPGCEEGNSPVDSFGTPIETSMDQGNTLVCRRTVYEPAIKSLETENKPEIYSIRLAPLVDHSQTAPITARAAVRKLNGDGRIQVGRFDRASGANRPIVYTSKVVSRNHAELLLRNGQWFIRDVGSSSGTFLNNERLSPASTPSELRRVTTGDILRFGLDFRGGQETQYRGVRVRVELDGGDAKVPQEFHKNQFSRLKQMTGEAGHNSLESCALCLEKMEPFNSLFVAPCCHMWHYRCIRTTLVSKYPYFECPLCRKTFHLEEDSGDDDDDDDEMS